ncbi:flagellin [Parvularcula dongshanensis]|uniref:Flagellar hook-associated protein 3 FlgL n=1 Tax=Parvularcula dongshanensis TaxID=1173995 RepID=A0A840I4B6_9PROT|nr:flagellin [Parvularcula dongshanensis]MBB4659617.1 flagellar hook-associated protein 3 FlgL [Parvularcula dongshanensis]
MTSVGLPDALFLGSLHRTSTRLRTELSRASAEMVSGERQDLSRTLGARAGELALVNKALGDVDASASRMALAQNRLRLAGDAVGTVREMIDGYGARALTDVTLGGAAGLIETSNTARALLSQTVTTLNVQHGGRTLFAGDATDGRALADAGAILDSVRAELTGAADAAELDARLTAFFAEGGGFDTQVYMGGTGSAGGVALSDGSVVPFAARADSQAVRNTIEGLVRLALGPELGEGGVEWTRAAAGKLEAAGQGLVAEAAANGLAANRLDAEAEAKAAERLVLTATRESLAGRDAFEAAAEVQRLEAQLEAAYTVTARLSRLSFTDYMR